MKIKMIMIIIIILTIALILSVIASIIIADKTIQTTHYVVGNEKIAKEFDGYKILQISDLHSKLYGKDNSKIIGIIEKENPNIVVMTGDMVNSTDKDFSVFVNLAKQKPRY